MRRKILEGDNLQPEIERLLKEKVAELTVVPAKNNPKFTEEFGVVIPLEDKAINWRRKER